LGELNPRTPHGGFASAVEQLDLVVGLSRTSDEELHAVVWRRSIATDLSSLIATDSGWVVVEATDINCGGEIVGVGTINRETHAFLLTPAEEHDAGDVPAGFGFLKGRVQIPPTHSFCAPGGSPRKRSALCSCSSSESQRSLRDATLPGI
jgi:probable HAF family extracellular repeat protein